VSRAAAAWPSRGLPARRGSYLLLCLVVVLALGAVTCAFLRQSQLQSATGDSLNRQILARQMAEVGATHALEEIMRDYVTEPFTRMDGPAHAAFVSEQLPYVVTTNVDSQAYPWAMIGANDVPGEAPISAPLTSMWWHGWESLFQYYNQGQVTWDGRGRYYEPGFYNRVLPTGFQAVVPGQPQQPTVAVPFGQDLDASAALPDLSDAVFYDEHFCRLAGDPRLMRAAARYRVRYAVGVMDMDGMLLANPDPGMDPTQIVSSDPRTYADPLLARVVRASHALPAIMLGLSGFGCGTTIGVRAEHVFLGRGFASNYDGQAATGFAPCTFPGMYRQVDQPQQYRAWTFSTMDNAWPSSPPELATSLFHTSDNRVQGLPQGGELLPGGGTFYHALTGPQFSPMNLSWSFAGATAESPFGTDGTQNPYGAMTPFGRGLTINGPGRYGAQVDSPWCVNVMTAPARVLQALVVGYLPAGVERGIWQPDLAWATQNQVAPKPVWTSYCYGSRDLFVAPLAAAFQAYPGPTSQVQGLVVAPDYHVPAILPTDPGYLAPQARYPGEMAYNGFDASGALVADTLGTYLRASGGASGPVHPQGIACEPSTGASLWPHPYVAAVNWDALCTTMPFRWDIDTNVPAQYAPRQVFDGTGYRGHDYQPDANSIWEQLAEAFAAAVAVARGQSLQYPNGQTDPATLFDGAPWSGARVQSIRDLDALFLANLGIDITQPAAPSPIPAWAGDPGGITTLHRFTPGWNLGSLRSDPGFAALAPTSSTVVANGPYSADEKTAVMELIINDFRMSLFGSSPDYGQDFRPLDLNGDGRVACSAFPPNPAATPRERLLHIDQYLDDASAAAGPVPNPFCLTGCLRMGKSKFWEVVSRGEVWDNVLKHVISEATLDTALVIDPADEARELDPVPADRRPYAQYSTHVLFRRWYFDKYRGLMGRDY